jgi:hypothetical protein
LGQFASVREVAIVQYRNFVRAGISLPPIRDNLKNQIFLADTAFVEKLQHLIKADSVNLAEIPKAQRRPPAKPLSHYVQAFSNPQDGIRKACESCDYTLQ